MKRGFPRFWQRLMAIICRRRADRLGRRQSMIIGPYGRRRVLHFHPQNGIISWHRGVHCTCDIDYELSKLRDEKDELERHREMIMTDAELAKRAEQVHRQMGTDMKEINRILESR